VSLILVMRWLAIIIGVIAAIFVFSRATFRVVAPFWSRQPVFHPYRLDLWFGGGRVIDPSLPAPDAYVDHSTMSTVPCVSLTGPDKDEVSAFLADYYLRTSGATYTPAWHHISAGMVGDGHPSFLCRGRDDRGKLLATISARPLEVSTPSTDPFRVYYVDNLCVEPGRRSSGVAPKAIRTLYHDIRHANHDIRVCLFKREGATMGIMPLTVFDVTGFQVGALRQLSKRCPRQSVSAPVSAVEVREAWDAALNMADDFRVVVAMSVPSAVDAVRTKALHVYVAKDREGIVAVALLRDSACTYPEGRALELAALLHRTSEEAAAAFAARACSEACKKLEAKLVLVDGCAAAGAMVDSLEQAGRQPVFRSRTSLFLYNYAEKPHLPATCALLF
jgi:hypothetical protein